MVSTRRQTKGKVHGQRDVEADSESDTDSVVRKSTKKAKKRSLDDSDQDLTLEEEENDEISTNDSVITTPRSSERLKAKSQRRYVIPNRKEALNIISNVSDKYENKNLRPRNLISDFVRGRSRYVTDRTRVFESSGSDLSDFIDDMEEKSVKVASKKRKKKREKQDIECSSSKNCSESTKNSGCRRRKSKHGKNESSGDSDVQVSTGKRWKTRKSLVISDDDENLDRTSTDEGCSGLHSDIQKPSKKKTVIIELQSDGEKSPQTTSRNLRGRTKSVQKEKEEELLAKISAKRNIAKLRSVNSTEAITMASGEEAEEKAMKDDYSFSDENFDNILDISGLLGEREMGDECLVSDKDSSELEERDSDREFVVEDEFSDSDAVNEFYKHLHNSENVPAACASNLLEPPRKKPNHFQRIQVLSESEDDDDDASSFNPILVAISNAVKKNNVNEVKNLIERNPTIIHEVGSKRQSLLHVAVICGYIEVVQLLLDFGADKFALDVLSLTPLAYAILFGLTQCLEILLQDGDLKKVNKRLQDHLKCSLLHFVVYGRILLPNLNCQTVSCMSDILKVLFEYDEILCSNLMERKDLHGFTPLVAAICSGEHQCIEYLVKQGASVKDFQSENGGNLLHLAVECSANATKLESEGTKSKSLHVLLSTSLKSDINAVDNCDFTPLMCAAQSGSHECVLALLESGASVHCKDKHDTTSLHLAAASGDTGCVKLLLQFGHKVDCLDSFGWPPLLYANFAAQESCVLSLMEPNPKQIFVLGDLLRRGKSKSAKERNFKVIKDVLVALANQDAYYRVFNDFIRCNPDILDEYDKGLMHQTWIAILDFDNKHRWFKRKLEDARTGFKKSISLNVNRDAIFDDTMSVLKKYHGHELKNCYLSVTFRNEPGICTGPKREFFVNICKDIVEPYHKLLYATDDNQYSLLPNAFFAEQTKKDGVRNNIELMSQNNKNLVSSPGGVCEDENGGDEGQGDGSHMNGVNESSTAALTEEEQLEVNNVLTSLSEGYMDEDAAATVITSLSEGYMDEDAAATAQLDLAELNYNPSFHSSELTASNHCTELQSSSKPGVENSLLTSEFVDKKLAEHLDKLKLLGRIIGLAICQGHFINLHLSKPLVNQILGFELNHPDDLSSLDYELHKNLVSFILENDDVDDEMLPCELEVINPWNGRPTTVKLFPDERKEEFVTGKNKVEYIDLVSKYKLSLLIEKEIDFLCQGLYEVISRELFSLFTADEFSLLINGVDKIDVDDWRKNTMYSPPDKEKREEVKWFWEVVKELKQEEKALLLKFSTGSPCLPAGGFADLQGLGGTTKFHITVKSERNKIPTASTCFNTLKLSSYDSAKELKDKLLIAIRHGTEGFSFS